MLEVYENWIIAAADIVFLELSNVICVSDQMVHDNVVCATLKALIWIHIYFYRFLYFLQCCKISSKR